MTFETTPAAIRIAPHRNSAATIYRPGDPNQAVSSISDYTLDLDGPYVASPLIAIHIRDEILRGTPQQADALEIFRLYAGLSPADLARIPTEQRLLLFRLIYLLVFVPAFFGLHLVEETEQAKSAPSARLASAFDRGVPLIAATLVGFSIALGRWSDLLIELPVAFAPLLISRLKLQPTQPDRTRTNHIARALHQRALAFFFRWNKTDFSDGLPAPFLEAARQEIAEITKAYSDSFKVEAATRLQLT
ncbi:hypothetical protein [Hyphomicrobium sp. DMF-1]|uniref:hypothetical protein n=1 Tax=Hyphomicrobium sp. DMF-1 TaxID=3019544 RepID=UPI0022EBB060|nr:hypothetical protein [Hyphomicrobium sp. DMF-1]WBT37999.1 hypothetical protein PE058_20435 [Hyphomicrobium sp. DMF-1]